MAKDYVHDINISFIKNNNTKSPLFFFFHFNTANPDFFPDVFLLLFETNNSRSVYALLALIKNYIRLLYKNFMLYIIKRFICRRAGRWIDHLHAIMIRSSINLTFSCCTCARWAGMSPDLLHKKRYIL